MSVATEFAPVFAPVAYVPEPARRQAGPPRPDATVHVRHRPADPAGAPPLRLTRRGVLVLSAAVASLAGVLVWLAALSAPAATPARASVPATVTVQDGDTLWSIAGQVAPDRDPRAEVDQLLRLNHLGGVALTPGQVLRTR
jgi:nucleoid-associated protein YgaU